MKWLLVFIVFIGASTAVLFSSNILIPTPNPTISSPTPTITSSKKQSLVINSEQIPIRISWILAQPGRVGLYSNLQAKQTSTTIKSQKNCKALINGGFYSTTNTHLGLIISNFETISSPIQSSLLNGFLWITSKNAIISSSLPPNAVRAAIQSGPLLMQEGKPLLLTIKQDKQDRRMVAATTSDKELIFLAIYGDKSELQGPLLGQLPDIIKLFKQKTNMDIVDAINLDGGSASAFITDFESLSELSMIGSYFCAK